MAAVVAAAPLCSDSHPLAGSIAHTCPLRMQQSAPGMPKMANMGMTASGTASVGRPDKDTRIVTSTPSVYTSSPSATSACVDSSNTRYVRRPGIAPLVPRAEQQGHKHEYAGPQESLAAGTTGSETNRPSTSTFVSSPLGRSTSYTSTRSSSSSSISSSSSMHHNALSRTSSCSSRTSSTSSIVRAIDFAYCLPSPGLFDGIPSDPRRGASSPSVTMSTTSNTSKFRNIADVSSKTNGRRPSSSGLLLYRSSSSASATSSTTTSSSTSSSSHIGGLSRSSLSSRRSSVYASSPSSSLASQFRDWAFTEGPLNNNSNTQRRKMSLHPSSPASSSDIFSPLTDVSPLPTSAYPLGMQMEDDFQDSAIIDDNEGLICFQPGCETTIHEGTYYCHEHDDPFGEDA